MRACQTAPSSGRPGPHALEAARASGASQKQSAAERAFSKQLGLSLADAALADGALRSGGEHVGFEGLAVAATPRLPHPIAALTPCSSQCRVETGGLPPLDTSAGGEAAAARLGGLGGGSPVAIDPPAQQASFVGTGLALPAEVVRSLLVRTVPAALEAAASRRTARFSVCSTILGTVDLAVEVREGAVSVAYAASERAGLALMSESAWLEERLEEMGLELDSFLPCRAGGDILWP